ncbi:MAG: TRAP transporter small permease [Betaproteobacteria bacterium]
MEHPAAPPGPRHVGPFVYFEEVIAGAALIIVVLSVCWGVVTRYITAQPATWTSEVAGIAFAWVVFVGAAAGFKYGMHMAIDMVIMKLPGAFRRLLMAAADVLVLAFLVTLLTLSIQFSIDAWGDPTSVLRMPRTITYASVVVGSACMLVRYARAAWRRWHGRPGAWLEVPGAAGAEL